MKSWPSVIAITIATILAPPAIATAADLESAQTVDDSSAPATSTTPWYSQLPLLAEEARKRGYELPLPFGAALILTGLDGREIEVTDVRIGLQGNPAQSVSDFVDLGSTSEVFNANIKFDAWLLPFLNLYALAGYVHNTSNTHARVTLVPGLIESETSIETELDGVVGGVGATLAGGYQNFYMVADCNYNRAALGFDDEFIALIASLRVGWMGKLGEVPLQMWVGVGNWDTAATAKGHGTLPNGAELVFEADQKPKTNWMYDVGANIEFSKRWQLVVDVGADFDGGYYVVIGPTFRFPDSAAGR
jgi:hypothetical protein